MFSPPLLKSIQSGVDAAKKTVESNAAQAKEEIHEALSECRTACAKGEVSSEDCAGEAAERAIYIKGDHKEQITAQIRAVLDNEGLDPLQRSEELKSLLQKTQDEIITASIVSTLSLVPGLGPLAAIMSPVMIKMVTDIKNQMTQEVLSKNNKGIQDEFEAIAQSVQQEKLTALDHTPHHVAVQLAPVDKTACSPTQGSSVRSVMILEERIQQYRLASGGLSQADELRIIRVEQFAFYARQSQAEFSDSLSTDPQKALEIVQGLREKCEGIKGAPVSTKSLEAERALTEKISNLEELSKRTLERVPRLVQRYRRELTDEECRQGTERAIKRGDETVTRRTNERGRPMESEIVVIYADSVADEFSLPAEAKVELMEQEGGLFTERGQCLVEIQDLFNEYVSLLCNELILFVLNLQMEEEQKSHERQKEIDEERYEIARDEVKRDILRQSIKSSELARENTKERVKVAYEKKSHHERVQDQYRLDQDRFRNEEHNRLLAFRRKIFETDRST